MARGFALVAVFAFGAACGGGRKDPPPVRDAPAPAVVVQETEPAPSAPTQTGSAPVHYDDDVPDRRPTRTPGGRAGRPIEILLRSSPVFADVAVDGRPLGKTPELWQGDADGKQHEFTFRADGYALARYRFIPITSGIVHASLEVITDEPNAVQDPPPEVRRPVDPTRPQPPPVNDALAPLALPPDANVVAPPDAAAGEPLPHGPTP